MFKALIWGECAIIIGMATIIQIMLLNSETLKKSILGKLIVYALVLSAVFLFLASFKPVRTFLLNIVG